eukprot:CAMPEP_0177729358 /NCGR_PEP_ID=MMETSP0484_2-20121128/21387_1 /TAXON_ID=354590 /ORGANISM="Rhodomonas lens, Strain RHODO" /LENGTH=101 /DNA_ID=CAMNT_0019242223 /DNA_START=300 /DNA_END=602 /DNA_ORIENTATION=+
MASHMLDANCTPLLPARIKTLLDLLVLLLPHVDSATSSLDRDATYNRGKGCPPPHSFCASACVRAGSSPPRPLRAAAHSPRGAASSLPLSAQSHRRDFRFL